MIELRWVRCWSIQNGRRVEFSKRLQYKEKGNMGGPPQEWHDIPLVEEFIESVNP